MRLVATFALLLSAMPLLAQDPLKVDPKHFRVEYEDEQVRVLRFTLPPGESSPMHDHLQRITVIVRGGKIRVTEADGTTHDDEIASGTVRHPEPARHAVENIGATMWEAVVTEFKWTSPLPLTAYERAQRAKAAAPPVVAQASPPVERPRPAPPPPREPEPVPAPTPSATLSAALEKPRLIVSPIEGAKAIRVNGTDLAYVEAGSGEPVIFVHGAVNDLRNWSRQLDVFATRYHVIAYSRRYHYPNLSTGKEHDYSYQKNADDLIAFIKALNLGKVHVVGHSYGAGVVLLAAAQHPDIFKSVVVMEPSDDALLPPRRGEAARYAREEIMGAVHRLMVKKKQPEAGLRLYMEWTRGPGGWDSLDPNLQQMARENMNSLADYSDNPETAPFTCDDGKKIAMPTMALVGEASTPDAKETSRRVAECVPGAQALSVPNAAQGIHRQNPEFVNQKLLEFLSAR